MPETLTLPTTKEKKHTKKKKKPPATQATKTIFMLSTTCPKYIILLMIHITDENGRPYHLQNQYLPLLHTWTVCQRKNSPSWSVSMLWSRSFTFKQPCSFTWSDSSRFWFTNYQPGILKKENRKITETFLFFSTPHHNFAYIYKNEIQNHIHIKQETPQNNHSHTSNSVSPVFIISCSISDPKTSRSVQKE